MLNFFFPFVAATAQPNPAADAGPTDDQHEGSGAATSEQDLKVASTTAVSQPKSLRGKGGGSKAQESGAGTGTKKAATPQRRSKRKLGGFERQSPQDSGDTDNLPLQSDRVEAMRSEPVRVVRTRTGQFR